MEWNLHLSYCETSERKICSFIVHVYSMRICKRKLRNKNTCRSRGKRRISFTENIRHVNCMVFFAVSVQMCVDMDFLLLYLWWLVFFAKDLVYLSFSSSRFCWCKRAWKYPRKKCGEFECRSSSSIACSRLGWLRLKNSLPETESRL